MTTAQPLCSSIDPSPVAMSAGPTLVDDRYEIVRPIATGGMGEILEARHRLTGRPVVLKVLRSDLVGRADVAARLVREARALGAIRHPGIVEIVDSGVCAQRGPFIVLEMLEGRPLDGIVAARGHLGTAGALTILRSLASALAEVHRCGFVHRDLKPANVFIASSRTSGERVKLLDFGVVGEANPGGLRLTHAGDLLGTLGYMAPEQLADVTLADPRSDLYALALVTLECLGIGLQASSKVRRERRPARAALGESSEVPGHVVDLLDEMLSLDRFARPSLAAEVLARLGDVGHPPTELLGYAAPRETRDTPTQCEPALRRARPTGEEARRQRRAPYITPVRLVAGGVHIDGRSEDISTGGMLVTVRGALRDAGPFVVRFALPTSGRVVSMAATPKWKRESDGRTAVGLEFANVDDVAAQSIASYVQYVGVEG